MTKRDGDKLRAMMEELREMADAYGRDGMTGDACLKIREAIEYALSAKAFTVRPLNPRTGQIYAARGEVFDFNYPHHRLAEEIPRAR